MNKKSNFSLVIAVVVVMMSLFLFACESDNDDDKDDSTVSSSSSNGTSCTFTVNGTTDCMNYPKEWSVSQSQQHCSGLSGSFSSSICK